MSKPQRGLGRTLLTTVLVATLVFAAVGPSVASGQAGEEPSFVVDLSEKGDAEIALTLTYDLTTDTEQAAFKELQTNETAQERTRERFRNRMAAVAADASEATGREMSIENPRIALETTEDGDVGIVTLRVTYVGLAAVDGDTLTVTEPFASGFEPDRLFLIRAPSGYTVADAAPAPTSSTDREIQYESGTSLSGFEASFTPAAQETATSTRTDGEATETGGQPGFGAIAAFVAVVTAAAAVGRRA